VQSSFCRWTTVERPQDLVDDVLVACLGTSRRRIDEVPAVDAFVKLIVTLPPRSTAPTVAGCRLDGCSVVSGRPLRSRAVAGVSLHVCVCLGPVLASHATSLPAAAAAACRGRGRVHKAGWSYGGVGPVRGLRGGGRRGWCEEWARRG
jgi:hypothetical protein